MSPTRSNMQQLEKSLHPNLAGVATLPKLQILGLIENWPATRENKQPGSLPPHMKELEKLPTQNGQIWGVSEAADFGCYKTSSSQGR